MLNNGGALAGGHLERRRHLEWRKMLQGGITQILKLGILCFYLIPRTKLL
jgi:hypothetical protein